MNHLSINMQVSSIFHSHVTDYGIVIHMNISIFVGEILKNHHQNPARCSRWWRWSRCPCLWRAAGRGSGRGCRGGPADGKSEKIYGTNPIFDGEKTMGFTHGFLVSVFPKAVAAVRIELKRETMGIGTSKGHDMLCHN